MRPHGSPTQLERRRRRAVALLGQGLSLSEVARRVGSHPSSVLRWRDALQEGGEAALAPKPAPGRPPRLTAREKERLLRLLLQGPMAHGHTTDLWTTQRIAELIERSFGVRYHRDHVGRLMHALGWSHQKPERRALERDEAAIERWVRRDWPRIKKTPPGWAPTSSSSTSRASS
jgi:transposase